MDEGNEEIYKFFLLMQINFLYLCLTWEIQKRKRWFRRRWLIRPINERRMGIGYFTTLFQELKHDPDMFFKVTRMTVETFYLLCEKLSPYLTKARTDISAEQHLSITLRYLSTGDSITSITLDYRVGRSTCYNIIKDTSNGIFERLSPEYLKIPSEDEWKGISNEFLNEWNLLNCCGAIDGKHIHIKAPANSGSTFYNYKKTYSIVLLAVCNAKYEFTLFDVDAAGSESDGGIIARSGLGKALRYGRLNLPSQSERLPGTDIQFPYYFVGDAAFQLTRNLMTPYSCCNLEEKKNIFNYSLSRARRTIENSFGILVSWWRFLWKAVELQPESIIKCVLASICLHNFLMKSNNDQQKMYCPPEFVDSENGHGEIQSGQWRQEVNNYTVVQDINNIDFNTEVLNAHTLRDTLTDYFMTPEGQVPWQFDYVRRGSFQDNRNRFYILNCK